MSLTIKLVQFVPTEDIESNLQTIIDAIEPAMITVFPEGSLSGYSTTIDDIYLESLDIDHINSALDSIETVCINRGAWVIVGSLYYTAAGWQNSAFIITAEGRRYRYNKVNLATHERSHLIPGMEFIQIPLDPLVDTEDTLSVQLCRELKYPEQWRLLSINGVSVIVHLNNAIGDLSEQHVWRSQLITRASENQRFVVSVNVADSSQKCPSMVIGPDGGVIFESSGQPQSTYVKIDLSEVSNWYLDQRMTDVVDIVEKK